MEADVLLCDAETEEDLQYIAQGAVRLGNETVWVGSAGLAYQLVAAAKITGTTFKGEVPRCQDGPMLFVVGSRSSVSQRQAELLEEQVPIHAIKVSPKVLLRGSSAVEWVDILDRVSLSLDEGNDTLIVLDAAEAVGLGERRGLTYALGRMLSPFAGRVGALVASGGETARAILNGWYVPSMRIIGEVERGIPCSVLELKGRSIPVLTKAGAFGEEDALLVCWQFLAKLLGRRESVSCKRT